MLKSVRFARASISHPGGLVGGVSVQVRLPAGRCSGRGSPNDRTLGRPHPSGHAQARQVKLTSVCRRSAAQRNLGGKNLTRRSLPYGVTALAASLKKIDPAM